MLSDDQSLQIARTVASLAHERNTLSTQLTKLKLVAAHSLEVLNLQAQIVPSDDPVVLLQQVEAAKETAHRVAKALRAAL